MIDVEVSKPVSKN